MKKVVWIVLAFLCASSFMLRASHTEEEKERLVRQSLLHAVSVVRDNIPDGPFKEESTNTWEDFLGTPTEEWTLEDRKDAFYSYLASLGISNMAAMEGLDQLLARAALSQCETLAFTNAVPALKAIGLNPNGLFREDAIELAVVMDTLNTNLIGFAETVMTNVTAFTLRERAAASARLASRILATSNSTDSSSVAVAQQATAMLYRNRYAGTAGAAMLDKTFCARYEGYSTSSNRLEYTCFILDHPNCKPYNSRRFTAITNELLSSGTGMDFWAMTKPRSRSPSIADGWSRVTEGASSRRGGSPRTASYPSRLTGAGDGRG